MCTFLLLFLFYLSCERQGFLVQQKMGAWGDTGAETGMPHIYGLGVPAFPAPPYRWVCLCHQFRPMDGLWVEGDLWHSHQRTRASAAAHELSSPAKVTSGPRLRWWNISSKRPESLSWRTAALGYLGLQRALKEQEINLCFLKPLKLEIFF